jgi:hypothetical protein
VLLQACRNNRTEACRSVPDEAAAMDKKRDDIQGSQDALPGHYYVLEKDGEYGYEQQPEVSGISEKAPAGLLMVRYRVDGNGVRSVQFREEGDAAPRGVIRCRQDCQFVEVEFRQDGDVAMAKTIRISNDPLIHAIMHDALNEKLQPYPVSVRRPEKAR